MDRPVKLKALDSFDAGALGTVHARSEFIADRGEADELIAAGLAVEIAGDAPASASEEAPARGPITDVRRRAEKSTSAPAPAGDAG